MYCLRVFFTRTTLFTMMFTVAIVVCSLQKYVYTKFRLDWLLSE